MIDNWKPWTVTASIPRDMAAFFWFIIKRNSFQPDFIKSEKENSEFPKKTKKPSETTMKWNGKNLATAPRRRPVDLDDFRPGNFGFVFKKNVAIIFFFLIELIFRFWNRWVKNWIWNWWKIQRRTVGSFGRVLFRRFSMAADRVSIVHQKRLHAFHFQLNISNRFSWR